MLPMILSVSSKKATAGSCPTLVLFGAQNSKSSKQLSLQNFCASPRRNFSQLSLQVFKMPIHWSLVFPVGPLGAAALLLGSTARPAPAPPNRTASASVRTAQTFTIALIALLLLVNSSSVAH